MCFIWSCLRYDVLNGPPHSNTSGSDVQAGVLFGLALHGYLDDAPHRLLSERLLNGSDTTVVALVLGLAASKRASLDSFVARLVALHLPSLAGTTTEISTSPVQQLAALCAAGLLYQGSHTRRIIEVFLFL